MSRPTSLPPHLCGTAFHVHDAESLGIPAGARAAGLRAPFRGVRSLGVDTSTLVGRCLEYRARMSRVEFFSHITAALLWGMPLPRALQDDAPLHVCVPAGAVPPRVRGVVAHQDGVPAFTVAILGGLAVGSAADTWCQLATMLRPNDLVAVADYLLAERRTAFGREPRLATRAELAEAVSRRPGARGVKALRWALRQARERVDSRMETLLRLLLVEAGLPEPEVNPPVAVDGGLTLHPDLLWARWRIVLEYEGDEHRADRRRFMGDIDRRERFEAAGWRVIRVVADDVFVHPEAFLARVRRVIRSRERELHLANLQ